jgi:hypothetical protein
MQSLYNNHPFYESHKYCDMCKVFLPPVIKRAILNGKEVCVPCYEHVIELEKENPPVEVEPMFNEPEHYHTHDIDTIEFLKRGFPPQVLTGFLIGNIIKYTQRFEYKNGEEDVLKIVDYAKRLEEWYKETHS